MTNPPQGDQDDDRPGDPDRYATQPAPSFERPQQPGAPHLPPSQPYGQPGYGVSGQPPYGQPPPYAQPQQYVTAPYGVPGQPYGQPAEAPPQKSRVGLIAAITGVTVLAIAGIVVLVMALQSTVLERAAVERDVAAQFEEREGVAIDLSCAEEMAVDPGATYECSGVTADDEEVTLQIRIEDEDSAAYTWTEP